MRHTYPDSDWWIEVPDDWLGIHAQRRDEVVQKQGGRYGKTVLDFAIALALLDDWNLPNLTGNPEKWDLMSVPLQIVYWVIVTTLTPFWECMIIPKNS